MKRFTLIASVAVLSLFAMTANAHARPVVDDEDDDSCVRYELQDVARMKMTLVPMVKGKADALGFFDAINECYWVEQWQIAYVYLHPEEDLGVGDNCVWETILDKRNGYLRVCFEDEGRNPDKNFVELCYWNMAGGKKLVALNFDYDHKIDDQLFTHGKARDILFYEFIPFSRKMQPVEPPVEGNVDLTGVRLPRKGRDLKLPGGRKLWWHNGTFTTPTVTTNYFKQGKPFESMY